MKNEQGKLKMWRHFWWQIDNTEGIEAILRRGHETDLFTHRNLTCRARAANSKRLAGEDDRGVSKSKLACELDSLWEWFDIWPVWETSSAKYGSHMLATLAMEVISINRFTVLTTFSLAT